MKRCLSLLLFLSPSLLCAQFTGHDIFVSDNRGTSTTDVIFSYDFDNGVGSTLNAANGDLDIYHDIGSDNPYVKGMEVDANGLFWTTSTGEIMFKAHGSASTSTLYSGLGTQIRDITVSGTNLFWHDEDTNALYKGSTDGVASASVLTSSINAISDMVATSDTIFYFTGSNNLVRQIDIATGTASTLVSISGETFTQFTGIAVYDNKIYAASTGIARHYSMDIDGTNQQQMTEITQFNIDDIDVVSGLIFLLDDGGSSAIDDFVYVYQLNDLSQNGTLISGLDFSSSLAVHDVAAVPEPATAALALGLLSGLLVLYRRRRTTSSSGSTLSIMRQS